MDDFQYIRPPIVEAVIELKFESGVDDVELGKLSKKYGQHYTHVEQRDNYSFDVHVGNENPRTDTMVERDYRLTSQDMSQILILGQSVFTLSQLPPYTNWNNFITRFERDWKIRLRHVGFKPMSRIGVRYINRIDIPRPKDEIINENEYLNIYPKHPEQLNPLLSYSINSRSELTSIGSLLTINSAVVQSPIPEHISIVVDTDIARSNSLPQNTDDILEYLHSVRHEKNKIFESCITDKTRELFNK